MSRHRLICLVLSLAALGPAAASARAADCANAGLAPAAGLQQAGDATLCLLNQQRAAAGLPALTINAHLTQMAADYAQQLVAQQFFDHVSPTGLTLVDRLAAVGYRFTAAGENLAWGTGGMATPAQIMDAWMHSAGHRANILDRDFKEIGVGIVPGSPSGAAGDGATYVTDFGTQPAARKAAVRRHHKAHALAARVARHRTRRAARPVVTLCGPACLSAAARRAA
jgi:uncharacterized protein YkwD